jgi:hypothetical protein
MKLASFLSRFAAIIAVVIGFAIAPGVQAAPGDVEPDEKIVAFINEYFTKMKEAGAETATPNDSDIDAKVAAAGKIAMNYYHRSHHSKAGDNLLPDRLRFSFKKGFTGIKFYQHPVKVTRVRALTTQAIGFKETAEKGKSFDYFLAKKEGVSGMPAQVRVFVGEQSGIKFDDTGSL